MSLDAVSAGFAKVNSTPQKIIEPSQSHTPKPEADEEKSKAALYMIGATALAAVVGLCIAGYKGKLGKCTQGVQKPIENATNAVPETAEVTTQMATEFKSHVKPFYKDGKLYSGIRETSNAKITYKDGYITKSELADGTVKLYENSEDPNIVSICTVIKPNGDNISLTKFKKGYVVRTEDTQADVTVRIIGLQK